MPAPEGPRAGHLWGCGHQCAKARGLAKELDYLPELVFGLVDASHIRKGDRGAVLERLFGVLLHRGQAPRAETVEGKAKQAEKAERHQQRAGAEHRADATGLDLDANAARGQVGDKVLVSGGVAKRRGRLHPAAIGLDAHEAVRLDLDLPQGAGIDSRQKVGEPTSPAGGRLLRMPASRTSESTSKWPVTMRAATMTGCNAHWLRAPSSAVCGRATPKQKAKAGGLSIGRVGRSKHSRPAQARAIPAPAERL